MVGLVSVLRPTLGSALVLLSPLFLAAEHRHSSSAFELQTLFKHLIISNTLNPKFLNPEP